MSLLFDTATRDDTPRRRARARPADPEPSVSLPRLLHARRTLGSVDGDTPCVNESCMAACHDITSEHRGRWLLECCFCGTGQWVAAIDDRLARPVQIPSGEFVFPAGERFGGMTLSEAKPEFVRWAAVNHENDEVRKACETYLASIAAPR